MVFYGVVWYCVIWYYLVLCSVLLCCVVWYCVLWFGVLWYVAVLYGTQHCNVLFWYPMLYYVLFYAVTYSSILSCLPSFSFSPCPLPSPPPLLVPVGYAGCPSPQFVGACVLAEFMLMKRKKKPLISVATSPVFPVPNSIIVATVIKRSRLIRLIK